MEQTFAASLGKPECFGLSLYIFVMAEMTDAWLNRSISHLERIEMAWTATFFLRRWHNYVSSRKEDDDGMMSLAKNGISSQSRQIFERLGNSLLALMVSHRRFYPDVPLLPWKHGTEAVEHLFGWMRVLLPHFTVLDARELMPKIFIVTRNIMNGKVKMPESESVHRGKYKFRSQSS